MYDADIRPVLLKALSDEHSGSEDSLIVEELGVCQGEARIDVAVINGSLHGYEIKSARDTLKRLPLQSKYYNLIFDRITLVASSNHLKKAMGQVPDWWGICEAKQIENSEIVFKPLRQSRDNQDVNPLSLVQLLWREEALDILTLYGFDKGMRSKSRQRIWDHLSTHLTLSELQNEVRTKLKVRTGWRLEKQQIQGAG